MAEDLATPVVIFGIILVVIFIVYVIYSFLLMKIAQKTKTENAWLAWIPIANIFLMAFIAKKNGGGH